MQCDYCALQATTRIPTVPGQVCLAHAIAFWTGLLAFSKDERRRQWIEERDADCVDENARSLVHGDADAGLMPVNR